MQRMKPSYLELDNPRSNDAQLLMKVLELMLEKSGLANSFSPDIRERQKQELLELAFENIKNAVAKSGVKLDRDLLLGPKLQNALMNALLVTHIGNKYLEKGMDRPKFDFSKLFDQFKEDFTLEQLKELRTEIDKMVRVLMDIDKGAAKALNDAFEKALQIKTEEKAEEKTDALTTGAPTAKPGPGARAVGIYDALGVLVELTGAMTSKGAGDAKLTLQGLESRGITFEIEHLQLEGILPDLSSDIYSTGITSTQPNPGLYM